MAGFLDIAGLRAPGKENLGPAFFLAPFETVAT